MTSKRLRRPVGCGACGGKRLYKTRGDAVRFLQDVLALRVKPHEDPHGLEVYRCPSGGGYHLGHHTRSQWSWLTGRRFAQYKEN